MTDDDEWPEFLTVQEVARITRLSTETVYRMVRGGTLDASHFGRGIRINADSVRQLLKTGGR
jgi:excisionase family DNA binding protein